MTPCVGCGRPVDRILPNPIPEDTEVMLSEAWAGKALYCQKCFDEQEPAP